MKSIMEEASTITKAIETAWNRAGQPQEFSVKILELPQTSFFGLKTSKSAKIALLFNEQIVKIKEQPHRQTRPIAPRQMPQRTHDTQDSRAPQPRKPHLQQRPLRTSDDNRQAPDSRSDSRQGSNQGPRPDHRRPMPQQQRPERPSNYQQPERPERAPRSEPRDERPARPEYREERYTDRSSDPRENWTPELVNAAHDWLQETLVLMGKPDIRIIPQASHNYLKLVLDQSVLQDPRQEETQLKSWGNLAMEAVREKAQKPLSGLRIILESKK